MNYIHPTALIGPNVVLGDNNYIGPYCIIGFPAEHKAFWPVIDGNSWSFPKGFSHVIIGDGNVFTGLVTIDAGTQSPTIIRDNTFIMKHSHVGHDAFINSGVTISCGAKIGGHAEICEGANIGLNATIHQRLRVPEYCMIGMGAVVTKKTQMIPQQKYAGNPAKWLGVNEVK